MKSLVLVCVISQATILFFLSLLKLLFCITKLQCYWRQQKLCWYSHCHWWGPTSSIEHVCTNNWYYWSQTLGWHMTNTIVTNDVSVTWADTSTTASGDPSMCVSTWAPSHTLIYIGQTRAAQIHPPATGHGHVSYPHKGWILEFLYFVFGQ